MVQRYGKEVTGGSESHCMKVAEKLSKHTDVEVITTCSLDYVTWSNYYKEGIEDINGVIVRRFAVEKQRDIKEFNIFSENLHAKPHPKSDEIKWMELQGPYSTKLIDFIKKRSDEYDFFIFFTYLYYTTFFSLPIVKHKAILVPTVHDEPPVYLGIFKDFFKMPSAILYNTQKEKNFVNSHFNNRNVLSDVVGVGVDLRSAEPDKFRNKYGITNVFLLYMGRIDRGKGCGELFDYFIRYKEETNSTITLVLIGRDSMEIPTHENIIHLGFIPEEDKYNAISASQLVVVPSRFESLSMALLEAWSCGIPALVNGTCEVLKTHCTKSNGGLWYKNYDEFKECLELLLSDKSLRTKLGKNGKEYVKKNYSWPTIERKYLRVLDRLQKKIISRNQ